MKRIQKPLEILPGQLRTNRVIMWCLAWLILFVASMGLTSPSFAQETGSLNEEWQRFHENPRRYMGIHPGRRDEAGRETADEPNRVFIDGHETPFLLLRRKMNTFPAPALGIQRERGRWSRLGFEGQPDLISRIQSFLDLREFQARGLQPVFTLEDMEAQNLLTGKLEQQPWSGSYWPIYQGGIAARYASSNFPSGSDWKAYADFVKSQPVETVLRSRNDAAIDELSPAEKYDLLIGNPSSGSNSSLGFLTAHMWREGEAYYRETGKVETWMGYCHGWAAASFMVSRPVRSVKAVAEIVGGPDGAAAATLPVKFYPHDLKALSSALWAKSSPRVNFVGGRCEEKKPATDEDNGRLLNPDCFDLNPALWHFITVNQIALAQRGFVLDVAYDYEVWNQPVYSYRIRYFNPQTGKNHKSFREALVARADYKKDRFSRYRSPAAATFVGVQMEVTYGQETWANHEEQDGPGWDALRTLKFAYDLELDAQGHVLGGEWYRNEHPDFAWVPLSDAHAYSNGDFSLPLQPGGWAPAYPVPAFWRAIAVSTAQVYGEPLAAILDPLTQAAAVPFPSPTPPSRH